MSDLCAVCGEDGQDRRTLRLSYLYELGEISPKFSRDKTAPRAGYSIRTCKDCRGDFLGLLRRWCAGEFIEVQSASYDRPIPIRRDGRCVYVSQEEWEEGRNRHDISRD